MSNLLLVVIVVAIKVQGKEVEGLRISNISIIRNADSVRVGFDLLIPQGLVKSNHRLVLQPVIYGSKGAVRLKKMYVDGALRRAMEWRKRVYGTPYGCEKYDSADVMLTSGVVATVKELVKLHEGMDTISFRIDRASFECDEKEALSTISVLKDVSVITLMKQREAVVTELVKGEMPEIKTVRSAAEVDKKEAFVSPIGSYEQAVNNITKTKESTALAVSFRLGVARIEEDYLNNRAVLNSFLDAIKAINGDQGATVKKVVVVGYASPDGLASQNEFVARKRAESLRDFLMERTGLSSEMFTLINGGEDWSGLRKMVAESDMPERKEVLRIIDEVPVLEGRESLLMELNKGETYRTLKHAMFPKLRNAGYLMAFYENKDDVAGDMVEKAIKLIKREKYSEALALLQDEAKDARAFYPIGVCLLRMGDMEGAMMYLQKAADHDKGNRKEAQHLINRLRSVLP